MVEGDEVWHSEFWVQMTRIENEVLYIHVPEKKMSSEMLFKNEEFCTKIDEDVYDFVKYIKYDWWLRSYTFSKRALQSLNAVLLCILLAQELFTLYICISLYTGHTNKMCKIFSIIFCCQFVYFYQ